MEGCADGLFQLLLLADGTEINQNALLKAASSRDSGVSWIEAADGWKWVESDTKDELINKQMGIWNSGLDPASSNLRRNIPSSRYFPEKFVEEFMIMAYSYSFHTFAEEYALHPNRTLSVMTSFC